MKSQEKEIGAGEKEKEKTTKAKNPEQLANLRAQLDQANANNNRMITNRATGSSTWGRQPNKRKKQKNLQKSDRFQVRIATVQ